jgi:hypothetical protein
VRQERKRKNFNTRSSHKEAQTSDPKMQRQLSVRASEHSSHLSVKSKQPKHGTVKNEVEKVTSDHLRINTEVHHSSSKPPIRHKYNPSAPPEMLESLDKSVKKKP